MVGGVLVIELMAPFEVCVTPQTLKTLKLRKWDTRRVHGRLSESGGQNQILGTRKFLDLQTPAKLPRGSPHFVQQNG